MFCNKCGTNLPENARHCPKCGMLVEIKQTEAKNKRIVLWIILAIVLVATLGISAFFLTNAYLQRNNKKIDGANNYSKSNEDRLEDSIDAGNTETDEWDKYYDAEKADDVDDLVNKEATPAVREPIDIRIRQVDNTNFPEMLLYVDASGNSGNPLLNINDADFTIKEISSDGSIVDCEIQKIYRLSDAGGANINLVIDQSGSMYGEKMLQAKNAANSLIDHIKFENGDRVEILTFDDYVYMQQRFTDQSTLLHSSINSIGTYGSTALLDALYEGVHQTYFEDGPKCVIGLTDGEDNYSTYSFDDVVSISNSTGIPIYIIGIGDEADRTMLQNLASSCAGKYYYADENNLESVMTEICLDIYEEQQQWCVIGYRTPNTDHKNEFRNVEIEMSEASGYEGLAKREYIPASDIAAKEDNVIVSTQALSDDEVESEVERIRAVYNEIQFQKANGQYQKISPQKGITGYLDAKGSLVSVEVTKGTSDFNYSRFYYYENDQLIFAYLESSDSHRLYYYNERLFRWRYASNAVKYSEAENHDNEDSEGFREWGDLALNEAKELKKLF